LAINNSTPPLVDYYTFNQINTQTCRLSVPVGSSTAYKNAPYWSDFTNIIETNIPSGNTENAFRKTAITVIQDGIILQSTEAETPFAIYNTAGKLIKEGIIKDKTLKIQFIAKGIFIVKIGSSTEKVIL